MSTIRHELNMIMLIWVIIFISKKGFSLLVSNFTAEWVFLVWQFMIIIGI